MALGKRAVGQALEGLALARVVADERVGNASRFRVVSREPLEALLGPKPASRTSHRALLRVAWAVLRGRESLAGASEAVREVEAGRALRELGTDARRVDPQVSGSGPSEGQLAALEAACVRALTR